MKIKGLTVDAQKIANGLYDMITDRGEEAIVAFGMIPKWIIDLFEKQLREKILEIAAQQQRVTVEELKPYVSEQLIQETMRPIVHEVTLGIYTAAKRAGKMCV